MYEVNRVMILNRFNGFTHDSATVFILEHFHPDESDLHQRGHSVVSFFCARGIGKYRQDLLSIHVVSQTTGIRAPLAGFLQYS